MLAFGLPAQAGEKLTLEQIPPKVQETIREYVRDGKLGEVEREQQAGQPVVYEANYTTPDGTPYTLEIGEDGLVLVQRGKLN
jgi:hypothetical protein